MASIHRFLPSSTLFRLLYSIHVEETNNNNNDSKSKAPRTQSTTSDEYDDISNAGGSGRGGHSEAAEKGVAAGEVSEVSAELKAVFVETMRTVSVDSTCTTLSETGVPVTPGQCIVDRPLFETSA